MNWKQKVFLWLGISVIVAMGLYRSAYGGRVLSLEVLSGNYEGRLGLDAAVSMICSFHLSFCRVLCFRP